MWAVISNAWDMPFPWALLYGKHPRSILLLAIQWLTVGLWKLQPYLLYKDQAHVILKDSLYSIWWIIHWPERMAITYSLTWVVKYFNNIIAQLRLLVYMSLVGHILTMGKMGWWTKITMSAFFILSCRQCTLFLFYWKQAVFLDPCRCWIQK